MKVEVCCCLMGFILLSDASAGLSEKQVEEQQVEEQQVEEQQVEEQQEVTLRCPWAVKDAVLWSRQRGGSDTDILSADGHQDRKYIADPDGRIRSGSDPSRSLVISNATASDSGRYLCDQRPAVDLMVIPAGWRVRLVPERGSIALRCLPAAGDSDVPSWRTEAAELLPGNRFHLSPLSQTLIISDVRLEDSGLYHCGGGEAFYLKVIPEKKRSGPLSTKQEHRGASSSWQPILRVVLVLVFLLVLVTITAMSSRNGASPQRRVTVTSQSLPQQLV